MTEIRAEYGTKNHKKVESKQVVTPEEAIKAVVYIQEAIINMLEDRGVTTRAEIMEEVKRLAASSVKPQQ